MNNNTNFVRRIESPSAGFEVVAHANAILAAVRADKISGDRELVRQSLYNYASMIEGFDPHLAGDLEDAAARL